MNILRVLGLSMALVAGMPMPASAAAVVCGSTNPADLRTVTINPGLTGGVCITGLVNFNPAQAEAAVASATGLVATHLDKDEAVDQSLGSQNAWLTGFNGATSGSWTVSDDAWAAYQRLFLGFHFGNAGDRPDSNPDWFIVEIARSDNAGTWALGGLGAQLNGLSHIDLIGAGSCLASPRACNDGGELPEPGSVALVSLDVGAAGLAARRSKR